MAQLVMPCHAIAIQDEIYVLRHVDTILVSFVQCVSMSVFVNFILCFDIDFLFSYQIFSYAIVRIAGLNELPSGEFSTVELQQVTI